MHEFAVPGPHAVGVDDGTWIDTARGRTLRWRRYAPEGIGAPPVVLFSHGLGGSRESGAGWLRYWASWGIAALAVQHPGTDVDALPMQSPQGMRRLLRRIADPEALHHRQIDLRLALDRIAAETAGPFGIAGHSYGAVSAMRLIGERRGENDQPADPRLAAAVLFSPSARGGLLPLAERFGAVTLPTLHLTGSEDRGIGPGDIDAADRCLPFEHMRASPRCLLVLDGARHTELSGNDAEIPRGPLLCAASTAFLRRHLMSPTGAGEMCRMERNNLMTARDRLDIRRPSR